MVEFYTRVAEIINVPADEIGRDTAVADGEWDSLVVLAIAAAIDDIYDIVIPVKKLQLCHTVGEILETVEKEKQLHE